VSSRGSREEQRGRCGGGRGLDADWEAGGGSEDQEEDTL
jgi:hypothetical protein